MYSPPDQVVPDDNHDAIDEDVDGQEVSVAVALAVHGPDDAFASTWSSSDVIPIQKRFYKICVILNYFKVHSKHLQGLFYRF
jgi:hypothetical protein